MPREARPHSRYLALAIAAALSAPAPAAANGLAERLDSAIRQSPLANVEFSLTVADTRTGRPIIQRNPDTPLIPASNQKIFVMAAAVDVLGPNFEFRTVLGLLDGDLVIIGDGDPAIGDPRLAQRDGTTVTAVFERWARAIQTAGHTRINGDLVIDESIFNDQPTHPTWEPADLDKWYGAPVGALNLNDNCIEFTVWPADPGQPPLWTVHPPTSLVRLDNRALSAHQGVPIIARPEPTFDYILTGRCGARAQLKSAAVPDPGLFFADVCKQELTRHGLTITGQIRRHRIRNSDPDASPLPVGLEVVAIHRTPLEDVLTRIGKNSQNLFADCLLKRLGYEFARRTGRPNPTGTWQSGAEAVTDFLNRHHIDTTGLVIADASGLSRANRATAAQLAATLNIMARHTRRDLFNRSLAVAGQDGSLRSRMKDLTGRVAAKTGTSRRVKSLSGYIAGPDDASYTFSIIINGYPGPSAPFNRITDDLCRILANHPGT